jgi:hypothetical protein
MATYQQPGVFKQIGICVGALAFGELVGAVSEEVTKRVKTHRQELGGPAVGTGSGKYDTMLDLLLDVTIEVTFLMIGINFVEKAMPSVDENLAAIILFIVGISTTQTHLTANLRKLTDAFMRDKDSLVVQNPDDDAT